MKRQASGLYTSVDCAFKITELHKAACWIVKHNLLLLRFKRTLLNNKTPKHGNKAPKHHV